MSSNAIDESAAPADEESIQPFDYQPPTATIPQRRSLDTQQVVVGLLFAIGLLLGWFLLSARSLRLDLEPPDATFNVSGGINVHLGSRVILRPGEYLVHAQAPGYESLEKAISVSADDNQSLRLALLPLPGLLALELTPTAAQVLVDGEDRGRSDGGALSIAAGSHALELRADRFLPHQQKIDIEGKGITQKLALQLQPAWGVYRLSSAPPGAAVSVDGVVAGTTPLALELLPGQRQLTLQLAGYAIAPLGVVAVTGEQRELRAVQLQRADRSLDISSNPSGASITLDGTFQGVTPLRLAVDSARSHRLLAFKAGFQQAERQIAAGSDGEQNIALALRALSGEVRFSVLPADAELRLGGRLLGRGTQTLNLATATQTIEVSRAGYATQQVKVTPRPGFTQSVSVRLRTQEQQQMAAYTPAITTAMGQQLVLIRPRDYSMGSSRREPGRRANEVLRPVKMQRLFYLGQAEVTNGEYRKFRPDHSSGNFKGKSLNGDLQPAAAVSWQDAARYCNWLSKQEGLPAFYAIEHGIVMGVSETGKTGYRLPSEAEWEWAARAQKDGSLLRFAWGNDMPPTAKAGNFADISGADQLGAVIAGYNDGFPAAAPVRKFSANRFGLFDMAGNAAEWIHDYYESGATATPGLLDPLGGEIGEYHVIRGPSWRHGTVTELRLSYRDYGNGERPDVGFRLARYAK